MRRGALALGGLVLAPGCAGLPSDDEGRAHFEAHERELRALCADAPRLVTTEPPSCRWSTGRCRRGLAPRMRAAGAQSIAMWPRSPGVELAIHTSGIAVSRSSMSLFFGEAAPYDVVPDTHPKRSAPAAAHGAFCTAVAEGWWLCRDWT